MWRDHGYSDGNLAEIHKKKEDCTWENGCRTELYCDTVANDWDEVQECSHGDNLNWVALIDYAWYEPKNKKD